MMLEAAERWVFEARREVVVAVERKGGTARIEDSLLRVDLPLATAIAARHAAAPDHGSKQG